LDRNGFSAAVVKLALHAPWGSRKVAFDYYLVDKSGNYKRTLDCVTSGSVSLNALDEIKRKAKFTLKDDGTIDFLGDRIKPICKVWVPPGRLIRQYAFLSPWQVTEQDIQLAPAQGGWAEFPLGEFLLISPERGDDESGTVIREVEAYDQTIILRDDKVDGKFLCVAGTSYTTAIKSLIEGAGIMRHNITASSKVLPADREWEAGSSKLTIINDLLESLNYWSVWFDEDGYAIASPYVVPADAPSEYTYVDDELSVIARPVKQKLDVFEIPNKWVFVVSEADRPTLRSVYINDNPSSKLSTVSRGFTKVENKQVDAADQTTLDSLVRRAASDAMSIYETIAWSSWAMPFHSHMSDYTFAYSTLGIYEKYREVSWEMELSEQGMMQHTARRSVRIA
jgi:hypothetical protein